MGSGGYGISVSASVNAAKGSEKGNGLTHSETTLDAGSQLSLTSGRDTTLQGAQASGESVKVDAGRNLTLTSEQDSDRYDSKQQSAGAGVSFTFGSMTGSANVNVSRDKMHSNWQSVAEQTGIFAGQGGFDVTVGEHTQLNGAVIASTATPDKNRLDTGTLGFGDIENHADYKVEHQGAGMSTGGSICRDQAITAIAQASGISWETGAGHYDKAMQTQALAAALVGAYGLKSVIKEPTKESSAKQQSQPSTGRTEPNRITADEEASGWSQYDKYRNDSGDLN